MAGSVKALAGKKGRETQHADLSADHTGFCFTVNGVPVYASLLASTFIYFAFITDTMP
jgi:hypothetical protein